MLPEYPQHHVTYAPAKFEVAMSNGLGGIHLQENTFFDLDIKVMKCCPVPATSGDICTCKVWSCYMYIQWCRRRCIYKKIHYLTFDQGHMKCCPVPHHVTCAALLLQSLKLLCPMVEEEKQLQENTLFDLWTWPLGQSHGNYCPVPRSL